MADEILIIYVIIATAGSLTTLVTAIYYWARLRLEHARSSKTEEYYTKRLLVEQKRADDFENYYTERVKLEHEKIAAEYEKIRVEKAKLKERGIELNGDEEPKGGEPR